MQASRSQEGDADIGASVGLIESSCELLFQMKPWTCKTVRLRASQEFNGEDEDEEDEEDEEKEEEKEEEEEER